MITTEGSEIRIRKTPFKDPRLNDHTIEKLIQTAFHGSKVILVSLNKNEPLPTLNEWPVAEVISTVN